MPLLVWLERLHIAGPFFADVGRWPGQQPGLFEDAVDAGRATGDDIGIEHHEGHAAIALGRIVPCERTDAFALIVGEPMIAWHPGIVFVDLAEACEPILVLASADAEPGDEACDWDVGFIGPGADEIDDLVACIVGHPTIGQGSPRFYFKAVWASISSAMTSFLRAILA